MIQIIKQRLLPQKQVEFKPGFYSFLNPWSYLLLRKQPQLLESLDGLYFDGVFLVKLFQLLGIQSERVSFDSTSLSPLLFSKWAKENTKIGICGSDEDSLTQSCQHFEAQFPGLKIHWKRNGFFRGKEREDTLQEILKKDLDSLVVGMGTPLQEQFLADLKTAGFKGCAFTCGGYLHQSTQSIQYYPKWVDRLNLRAFYRVWDEPKLAKRYFLGYPLFLFYFCVDLIKFKLGKHGH